MNLIKTTNIFIIEDNVMYAAMLKKVIEEAFQNEKFEIEVFNSGEDCAKALDRIPDLVIVDYHLSPHDKEKMNGIQIMNVIKKKNPSADFIMITMDESTQLFLNSKETCIYDYLTKGRHVPYNLTLSITRWLKWKN